MAISLQQNSLFHNNSSSNLLFCQRLQPSTLRLHLNPLPLVLLLRPPFLALPIPLPPPPSRNPSSRSSSNNHSSFQASHPPPPPPPPPAFPLPPVLAPSLEQPMQVTVKAATARTLAVSSSTASVLLLEDIVKAAIATTASTTDNTKINAKQPSKPSWTAILMHLDRKSPKK